MKNILYSFVVISVLTSSCKKDPEPEPEPTPIAVTPSLKATVDNSTISIDQFGISTSLSNSTYQITARTGDDKGFTFFIYDLPTVKNYTISENSSESGASITWSTDLLSSTTNHKMFEGTLNITKFENKKLEANFSGKAKSVIDSTVIVNVTNGTVVAQFP